MEVLSTCVLKYIFEVLVLVLVYLTGHVLVLILNVLAFNEYIMSTSEYLLNICCEINLFVVNKKKLS